MRAPPYNKPSNGGWRKLNRIPGAKTQKHTETRLFSFNRKKTIASRASGSDAPG